jgi:hypothetical protein
MAKQDNILAEKPKLMAEHKYLISKESYQLDNLVSFKKKQRNTAL